MAFPDALQSQPASFDRPERLYCFDGILRTAWPEATTWAEKGADQILVSSDQCDQRPGKQFFWPMACHGLFVYSVLGSISGA